MDEKAFIRSVKEVISAEKEQLVLSTQRISLLEKILITFQPIEPIQSGIETSPLTERKFFRPIVEKAKQEIGGNSIKYEGTEIKIEIPEEDKKRLHDCAKNISKKIKDKIKKDGLVPGTHPMIKIQLPTDLKKKESPAIIGTKSSKEKPVEPEKLSIPARDGLPWAASDDKTLIDMTFSGHPGVDIATALKRGVASIHQRRSILYKEGKLKKPAKKEKKKPQIENEALKSGYF